MEPDITRAMLDDQHRASRPGRGNNQPLHAAEIADALLTLRTASAVAGISPATIYRRASTDPTFPRLIRLGARCTRIRAGDLTEWLAAKAEAA